MSYFRSLLFVLFLSGACLAGDGTCQVDPNWVQTLSGESGDRAVALREAPNGDLFMAGYTRSFVNTPFFRTHFFWAARMTPQGDIIWQKQYGAVGEEDFARDMVVTADGGLIIVGSTARFSDTRKSEIWVIRLDGDGNTLWEKAYGTTGWETVFSISQTTDGGFILCGSRANFPSGGNGNDAFVLKMNQDGVVQWAYSYGAEETDRMNEIIQTPDGGYIAVGNTASFGATRVDGWVLRLHPNGFIRWQRRIVSGSTAWSQTVQPTPDGGFLIGGISTLSKIDALGEPEWEQRFHRTVLADSVKTNDGHYVFVGDLFPDTFDESEVVVHKYTADGIKIWQRYYGGNGNEWPLGVSETANGSLLVAGVADFWGVSDAAWLFRLKPDGRVYFEPRPDFRVMEINDTPPLTSFTTPTTDVTPISVNVTVTLTTSVQEDTPATLEIFAGCSVDGAVEDWPCSDVVDICELITNACP